LSVTPQISADGVVMLSLSPILATRAPANDNPTVVRRAIHEADTLARVADGETLVLSGFTRERAIAAKNGWFGRNTTATHARVAVLILLTPRIR
jgi:type II secretory pathway component GspD/PulD (secretin)